MADQEYQDLAKEILSKVVDKSVSEKLGTYLREANAFLTKEFSPAEMKQDRLLILGMMEEACDCFFVTMRHRIERQETKPE